MSLFDSIGSFLTAPITAGSALLGSALSAGTSLLGGLLTNSANSGNIAAQEAYQTNMSDTSYQRATADMEAAGLNPILAYSMGGASTPMGGTPVVNNVLGQAANSGFDAYSTMMSAGLAQQQMIKTAYDAGQSSLQGDVTGDFDKLYNNIGKRASDGTTKNSAKTIHDVPTSGVSGAGNLPPSPDFGTTPEGDMPMMFDDMLF